MRQIWHIRIRGKQRKEVDMGLLVQAIIQFARELEAEQTDGKSVRPGESLDADKETSRAEPEDPQDST